MNATTMFEKLMKADLGTYNIMLQTTIHKGKISTPPYITLTTNSRGFTQAVLKNLISMSEKCGGNLTVGDGLDGQIKITF